MSFLLKNTRPKQIAQCYRIFKRHALVGHFFPEYKPGPYPKTKEEREAAAKKYNLLPEEYEPYPEDEAIGDYPKLPFRSVDSKDPWYPWDHEELRRNYNEPVHKDIIILFPELLSTGPKPLPYHLGILLYISFCSVVCAIIWYCNRFHVVHPITEKQLPNKGPHYTFELDYDELETRRRKNVCVCDD